MNECLPKKPEKPDPKYICTHCDFKCSHKNDWNKHINRPKHLRNIQEQKEKIKKEYICKCFKHFQTAAGFCKHKKKCDFLNAIKNNTIITNNSEINEKQNQNKDKDIIAYLIQQNKMLLELLKSGTNNVYNNYYYNDEHK